MGCCCRAKVEDSDDAQQAKTTVMPFDKRGCTDVFWLLLFIAGWVIYIIVTIAGVQSGNLVKLYKPRDFSGAYCGVETNWNNGPNLLGKDKMAYTMNVSAMVDQVSKQLLCSLATSTFLLGGSSPLTATQQDEYACACCLSPCLPCQGSLDLGQGGDVASTSGLSSTIASRMAELTSMTDGGSSLSNPAGFNGNFFSDMWDQATQYLTQVCLPSCTSDYREAAGSERTYTYRPSADNPLRTAWDAMLASTHPAAGNIPATMASRFTFEALPEGICSYDDVYCVPMPGLQFGELAADYCGFELSADVINAVGDTAADVFTSLGGNAFAEVSVETLGTYMGDFEKSIDSFFVVAVLSFIVGIIFLVLLRFFIGTCVWVSILLVVFLFLIGGGIIFVRSGQCAGAGLFESGLQMGVAVTVAGSNAVTNAVTGEPAPSEELTGDGSNYVGVQTRTRSGYLCKHWDQAGPRYWPGLRDEFHLNNNFCRNPYEEGTTTFKASTIWCYTTDSEKRWELCSPVGVVQPECSQGYAVNSETGREFLKVMAIIVWSLGGIFIIVVGCCCSRIRLAIALNKVAATFLSHTPYVVVVPILQAAAGVIWGLVWALSACFLLSQVPDSYTPKEAYLTYAEAYGTADTPGACTGQWPTGFVYRDETCTLEDPRCWRCGPPRYIFDVRFFVSLFMYLWNNAFIIALGQTCIAGAVGVWFFTPNNKKGSVPCVWNSVRICFRYHTGSMAFGAFILALVQFIRWVLLYFQKQAEAQKNKCMACLARVLQYALWCLEKFIKFLNKNAYIQVALQGTTFCTSARKAWEIITNNLLRFGVVAVLGRVINLIGLVFIMASTTTVGYFILKEMHHEVNPIFSLFLYLVIGYIVGRLYMTVFGMAVDTSLQCVTMAEGMEHDGSFVPSALRSVLGAQTAWTTRSVLPATKPAWDKDGKE